MSFDLSGIEPLRGYNTLPARPAPAAAPTSSFAGALAQHTRSDRSDAIPASPPPELREETLVAQRAVAEMRARGRELHFEMGDGRLRIEMRDLDGNVLKAIPPTEALAIASGRIKE
jgi:flagellar protein FlaG